MKGHLLLGKDESGFFLPFVIYVVIIIFSVITTTLTIYNNDLNISNQSWEQMKAETIVQMSVKQFKLDKPYVTNSTGTTIYEFPTGNVIVNYKMLEENQYLLMLTIETDRETLFSIHKRVKLSE